LFVALRILEDLCYAGRFDRALNKDKRVMRFWLEGANAGMVETFADLSSLTMACLAR